MAQIYDQNSKNFLRIDTQGRARVNDIHEFAQQALESAAFIASTGTIGLTSSTESGIFYLKNTNSSPLIISKIVIGIATTGTIDDSPLIRIIKNPNAGTVVSDAIAPASHQCANFGLQTAPPSVTAYKGSEGKEITGSTDFLSTFLATGMSIIELNLVLPTNSSLGVYLDTQTSFGTTNVTLDCYYYFASK